VNIGVNIGNFVLPLRMCGILNYEHESKGRLAKGPYIDLLGRPRVNIPIRLNLTGISVQQNSSFGIPSSNAFDYFMTRILDETMRNAIVINTRRKSSLIVNCSHRVAAALYLALQASAQELPLTEDRLCLCQHGGL
jgi:hypothetical protein